MAFTFLWHADGSNGTYQATDDLGNALTHLGSSGGFCNSAFAKFGASGIDLNGLSTVKSADGNWISPSGPFTVSFWLYPSEPQTATVLVIGREETYDSTNALFIDLSSDGSITVQLSNGVGGGTYWSSPAGAVVDGAENFIAVSRTGDAIWVTINGSGYYTGTYSGFTVNSSALPITIGGRLLAGSPVDKFTGGIDEVCIDNAVAHFVTYTPTVPTSPWVAAAPAIAPTVGHVSASGKVPSVSITTTKTISPTASTLSASGKVPSISFPTTQQINPTVSNAVLSGKVPGVFSGSILFVSPATRGVAYSGYVPDVGVPNIIAPTKSSVIATGYYPLVGSPDYIAPIKSSISATGGVPSISKLRSIYPTNKTIGFTGLVCEVSAQKTIRPLTVSAVFFGGIANVSKLSEINPQKASAAFGGNQPSTIRDSIFSPLGGSFYFSGSVPYIYNGKLIDPGTDSVFIFTQSKNNIYVRTEAP